MQCNKCPHAAAVAAGKYRRLPFAKTPCATCTLRESSLFTMAYDENRGPEPKYVEPEVYADDAPPEAEPLLPMSVMMEAARELLSLAGPVRDVICWRFQGVAYREIARRQGTTIGAAEMRHWRAMRRWPALRALFAEKTAKQRCRKPHGLPPKQARTRQFRAVSGGGTGAKPPISTSADSVGS